MRIILAGGGTAGHINPALAIANYITEKHPDVEILYIGCKGKMEEKLVTEANYKFKGISISGFSRKFNLEGIEKNLITLGRLVASLRESKKIIAEFKPDICIGTGGYVSGPVLRQANKMGIPTIIHEQNAFPGITTKMLSQKVKCVMLATDSAKKHLKDGCIIRVTGNPVRKEIIMESKENARKRLGIDSRPLVLSFGGSLGAKKINEAVLELIKNTAKNDQYQHIHAYGGYDTDFIKKLGLKLEDHINLDIREYIKDMQLCLAAADLVICRAGAMTLSELMAQGKPAILIPSPNVTANHQYHNAMDMVTNNAASIIEEKNLTGKKLIMEVDRLLKNKEKLNEYSKNSAKMAILDSTKRIYDIIRKIVQ